ncbi:hypothetical protein LSTR_LSTR011745 [Laodelphax striatellus]|uniref:BTB domain-containing protein n=1 Tax=Laodelphax striatellus TaxID=195883 RepID=A0A482WLY3_LAOST|nr:hypothetical protein LSTR_LSTR011745 [Laodelphax striatellus]
MANDGKSSQKVGNGLKDKSSDGEVLNMKRFIKLVKSLNTISKTGAEKALKQIRDDILKHSACIKYLCDNKLFKSITKFLDFPNEKVLNLSISILATCCVNEESRIQVKECKAVPQMASVLNNISQDGVQNRTCRLVANLAQSKEIVQDLHKHKVVESIVKILSSNSSSGTQQSGIRALRVLYESLPHKDWTTRESMLLRGVPQVVGEALKTQNKDLIQCALRALQSFTTDNRGARQCVQQFPPAFYPILVPHFHNSVACQVAINLAGHRVGLINLNECYALKTVINIFAVSVFPTYLSDLASASCSSEASSPSSPYPIISDSRHVYLLSVLMCKLCDEVTGRTQLLHLENGSSVFLHLLRKEKNHAIKKQLFNVLGQFALEPATLKCLASYGLVNILVDKLERYTISHAKPHGREEAPSCDRDQFDSPQVSPQLSPHYSDSSPSRTSPGHAFCASPTASSDRSGSPRFAYSPVCSSSGIDSDADAAAADEPLQRDAEKGPDNSMQTTEMEREDELVIDVLLKLTCAQGKLDDLVSTRTLDTILNYKRLVNQQTFCRLITALMKIVSEKNYYSQLLDCSFVLKMCRAWYRPEHSTGSCNRCEKLSFVGERVLVSCSVLAETGLGEGEMAHRLLKGSDSVKFQIALTVPLVVRETDLLRRLLYKYRAYQIMTAPLYECESLRHRCDEAVLEDIAFSIKELFKTLRFTNPQVQSSKVCKGCDILGLRHASSVTFQLDDGSLVPACKKVLTDNSPVFEAMFRGGFRESEETQVQIHDVSASCLQHFVRLVDVYCECTLPTNVTTLLELAGVADRFLVAGLSDKAIAHLMNSRLDYRSCREVYQWAITSNLPPALQVSQDVIKYIFSADLSRSELSQAVASMILKEDHCKDAFLKDVELMIRDAIMNANNVNRSKYLANNLLMIY